MGEFDSLEAVRQLVREDLLRARRQQAEQAARDQLRRTLAETHEFAVPETLVERQIERRLERLRRQIAARGMSPEMLDWGKLRASQQDAARGDVKSTLILEKIAAQENLEVLETEVEQEIEKIAAVAQQTPAAVRTRLTKEGRQDRIISALRIEKALEFVLQCAKKSGTPG